MAFGFYQTTARYVFCSFTSGSVEIAEAYGIRNKYGLVLFVKKGQTNKLQIIDQNDKCTSCLSEKTFRAIKFCINPPINNIAA